MNNSAELYSQELMRRLDPAQADCFTDEQRDHVLQALRILCEADIYEAAENTIQFGHMQDAGVEEIETYINEGFDDDSGLIEAASNALPERFNQSITSDLDLFATYLAHTYLKFEEERNKEQSKDQYDDLDIKQLRLALDLITHLIVRDFRFDENLLVSEISIRKAEHSAANEASEFQKSTIPMA